jgi:hypothetical protein
MNKPTSIDRQEEMIKEVTEEIEVDRKKLDLSSAISEDYDSEERSFFSDLSPRKFSIGDQLYETSNLNTLLASSERGDISPKKKRTKSHNW